MSDRVYKINELIREEVSTSLLREMTDHKGIVTVTAVETTPDLRYSTVWYRIIGGDDKVIERILADREKVVQKTINKRLSLKHVPKISFRYDKSGQYVDNINRLIEEANDDRR